MEVKGVEKQVEGQEANWEETDICRSQVLGPHLVSDTICPGIGCPGHLYFSPSLGPEMNDSLILANGIRILEQPEILSFCYQMFTVEAQ